MYIQGGLVGSQIYFNPRVSTPADLIVASTCDRAS